MHVHTFNNAGGAFTGDTANNSGFSWSYQERARTSEGFTTWARTLEVQALFAGQVSQPVPAVVDDFGTIVVTE